MMRDRGKRELEAYNNGDCFAETIPEFPCKKHPALASSSAGGICAYCLTDRLVQLVCTQCGEQRLSSYCACSETFSNPNPNSSMSDVGRISFLLENDQKGGGEISSSKPRNDHRSSSNNDDSANLRRSNSISATDMNKGKKSETGKLWKIGRLFRKKRDKTSNPIKNSEENYECNGVSRSRSLCSFRGFYDPEENGGFPVSNSAARASSVSTGNFMVDSAKRSCFSESEARISNFDYYDASNFVGPNKNNIFSLKETEFVSCDDPAYIDLKLNETSNNNNNNNSNNYNNNYNYNYNNNYNYNYNNNNNSSNMSSDYGRVPDLASMRRSGLGLSTKEYGYRGGGGGGGGGGAHEGPLGHEMFRNGGGSCRVSDVSERDLRKCRKSYKVWKWFSKHQTTTSSKFDDHDFKS